MTPTPRPHRCAAGPRARHLAWASCCALLAACGGGDGGGSEASAAPPPQTAASAPLPPTTWWQPAVTASWHIQLSGTLQTNVDVAVFDLDLHDTPASTIAALRERGLRVVCYFSAGTSENWRSDFARFAATDMGQALPDWPGERWLDTRSANVRAIMGARLDLARSKGCDGVDPDNVDGHTQASGFGLTAATQLDYNRWLAEQAHARGLAVGLKNDVGQLAELVASYDFAVNEQCHQYNECEGYGRFVALGKPVFNIEYAAKYVNDTGGARSALCTASAQLGLRTLVLPLALDGSRRYACP